MTRARQPRLFLLENVVGLVNINGGADFTRILKALRDLKCYEIHWAVLNSEDYGVPQHRPRLYILGIDKARTDTQRP